MNTTTSSSSKLLTTREVADMLGVGVSSVKRWTEQGDLACVRTAGGHRRFELPTVQRFLKAQGDGREAARSYPAGMLNIDGHQLPAPLHEMSAEEIDALPFGVIQLDDDGRVLLYSRGETRISGYDAERVLGRPFFTEVAPCTNNRIVRGRFEEGVMMKNLDCSIDYTFTYKMKPTMVRIRLRRDGPSGTNWLLITPQTEAGVDRARGRFGRS